MLTFKRWQERVMDIYGMESMPAAEIRAEYLHVACQDHQVYLLFLEKSFNLRFLK